MPEVHVYVSAKDKALIANLPPGIKVADLLRHALAGHRRCPHDQTTRYCASCGATLEATPTRRSDRHPIVTPSTSDVEPIDTPSTSDVDIPTKPQVNDIVTPSTSDLDPMTSA